MRTMTLLKVAEVLTPKSKRFPSNIRENPTNTRTIYSIKNLRGSSHLTFTFYDLWLYN